MNYATNVLRLLLVLFLSACGSQVVEFGIDTHTDTSSDANGGDITSADGSADANTPADADSAGDIDANPDTGADTGTDAAGSNAPTVVATWPVNGATGVPMGSSISAAFSKAMDAATLTELTFRVQRGSTPVLGTVSFDATTATATFGPAAVLLPSTVYTCTVTIGAKSADGIALTSDYVWAFTTTAAAAVPPTVESTTPMDNAQGVSTATKVSATFSKSMDPQSISALTFTVLQGTSPVVGAVSYDAATNTATFSPDTALKTGLIYTATITTGVADAVGLHMALDYTWIFTSNAIAAVAPTVNSTTPLAGALLVPPAAMPTATFSKSMDPLTIGDTTFLVKQGGAQVSGSVSLDSASNTATFAPDEPLEAGKLYTATITTGASDLAGTALAANYSWSFTTAAAVLVAPQVQTTSPLNLAVGVAIGKKPSATFSKPMDPKTITNATFALLQGATPVAGSVSYDAASQTATFLPATALKPGSAYLAKITTGAMDADGLALAADYTWTFATAASAAVAPTVDETTPLNAASDVPVGSKLTATFSKAMDPLTITALSFAVSQGLKPVLGVVSLDNATHTATFAPAVPLGVGLAYSATITTAAKDSTGLALAADYTWSFTTATPPQVTATTPLDKASKISVGVQPTATFNKAMDPLTLTALTFTVLQGATPVAGTVSYKPATKTATFKPALPLAKGLLYTCTITTGVKDLGGLQPAASYVWTFATSEAAPTVLSTTPLNLATSVSINKRPTATFSKAMNPQTLDALSFTVKLGLLPVTGTVSYDSLTKTATFTPSSAFVVGKVYTATITTGAKDTGGSPLALDYVWSFTTSACSQAPVVLGAAGGFVVLGGSTVTNTGPTSVTGDLGVSPGTAVTGFPPGTLIGSKQAGNPAAAQGMADLTTAYNDAAGRTLCPVSKAGNLGGMTLAPGLYKSTSSLSISSGDLTLDAQGDGDAVFIFQMASTLTTTSGRQVILANGAKASNVFWQVGTSATLGSTSAFVGTIMADQAITLKTGATLTGRALARIAAVALDSNVIVMPAK